MRVPEPLRTLEQRGIAVRAYEDETGGGIVVDFGDVEDVHVDVVGRTVIAAVGAQQYEFELPIEANDVSLNNGVLTITE